MKSFYDIYTYPLLGQEMAFSIIFDIEIILSFSEEESRSYEMWAPDCCCYVASVMSDSVRPQRRQPTRLPRTWDSPGKNTGVGCHFLLQCMKVKSESEVTQLCPTLRDPMDFSLPGSSVHGIFQVTILEWAAISFSWGSSQPRSRTWVSHTAGRLYHMSHQGI